MPHYLGKFMGKKDIVYVRKEFNSHRICLEHQHGRRFIVLEHYYGRRDVTRKRSIELSVVPLKGHWLALQSFPNNNAMLRYLYGRSGCMSLSLQNGGLGFWNLCDIRRTEKKFVHISLLNALLLFMGCRSRLRDCPRNIDVECSFGVSSHWGACCSSSCCDLKHLLRPWIFLQAFLKRTCAGFYGV